MKFIIILPTALEPYCYPMGKSKNGNWWIWGDKSTSLLRIYSPSHNPWGKEWLLQPTEVKQKSDNSEYTGRLDFRLYLPEQALSEGISRYKFTRERYKSKFPVSRGRTDYFTSFPVEDDPRKSELFWISYALIIKANN